MARRVVIRSRDIGTGVAQLEEMIKRDFKEIYKDHMEDLEATAEAIVERASYIVPNSTGRLASSISARVSNSKRYPGLMVSASAKSHGFDYALIQEENEKFSHGERLDLGDEANQRMAHYLGGSFAIEISYLFEELTNRELELPEELEHAKDYVESRGG